MKITNKLNLPSGFVNIAKEEHEFLPKVFSATEIMGSTRQILLWRRNHDEIEQDCSDMVNMIFGTAVHHVLEQADTESITEKKLITEIKNGYQLSGRIDIYNEETFAIEDYKSTSVWKIIFGDFEDWRKQGLIYAWLAKKNGLHVEKLKFHALLKDWKPSEAKRKSDYPPHQVWTWEYNILTSDLVEIEDFIKSRFDELIYYEDKELLPLCTEEERWFSGDKFAVMKKGRKRASRVFDDEKEAQDYLANSGNDYIEKRPGEDKKCENYCSQNKFCSYWKDKHFGSERKE